MKIRVRVPDGRTVPMPRPDGRVLTGGDKMPTGGWEVELTTFVRRRLRDRDLEEVTTAATSTTSTTKTSGGAS